MATRSRADRSLPVRLTVDTVANCASPSIMCCTAILDRRDSHLAWRATRPVLEMLTPGSRLGRARSRLEEPVLRCGVYCDLSCGRQRMPTDCGEHRSAGP